MRVIAVMYAAAGLGIVFEQFQTITLMVVFLCMLYFAYKGQIVEVYPLAILFNDDLGSIAGGFSVYMMFVVVYALNLIMKTPRGRYGIISHSTLLKFPYYALALLFNSQMLMTNSISLQRFFIGVFVMIWTIDVIQEVIQTKEINKFLSYMSLTIAYAVILSAVTGFSNTYGGAFSMKITRAGLLGHGAGIDPNFAGLTITMGIIMLLMTDMKISLRIVAGIALAFGVFRTVSLTTAGISTVAVAMFFFIKAIKDKRVELIKYFITAFGVLIIVLVCYENIEKIGNQSMIDLKNRVDEAIVQLNVGDWNDVSSDRKMIVEEGMSYYNQQSYIKKLFGGNELYVLNKSTHNTYLQHLLQIGAVGLVILVLWASIKAFRWGTVKKSVNSKVFSGVLTLKICLAVFISTLAVNSGVALCLWVAILYYL